jgi:hypothetical protein
VLAAPSPGHCRDSHCRHTHTHTQSLAPLHPPPHTQAVAQAATSAGARSVLSQWQRQAALAAAQQGLTSATLRYSAVQGALSFLGPVMWAWLAVDLVKAAVGTDYARVVRAVYILAQVCGCGWVGGLGWGGGQSAATLQPTCRVRAVVLSCPHRCGSWRRRAGPCPPTLSQSRRLMMLMQQTASTTAELKQQQPGAAPAAACQPATSAAASLCGLHRSFVQTTAGEGVHTTAVNGCWLAAVFAALACVDVSAAWPGGLR